MGIISSCLETVFSGIFREHLVRKARENNVDCLLCTVLGGIEKEVKLVLGQKQNDEFPKFRLKTLSSK